MNFVVESFMANQQEFILFRRDPKGIAARMGRMLVLPARNGLLPPIGVPIRPTRIEDKGRFLVAHGPWVLPDRPWLATVMDGGRVTVHARPVGVNFAEKLALPVEPSVAGRLPVGLTVWGKLVLVDGQAVFVPHFCS